VAGFSSTGTSKSRTRSSLTLRRRPGLDLVIKAQHAVGATKLLAERAARKAQACQDFKTGAAKWQYKQLLIAGICSLRARLYSALRGHN